MHFRVPSHNSRWYDTARFWLGYWDNGILSIRPEGTRGVKGILDEKRCGLQVCICDEVTKPISTIRCVVVNLYTHVYNRLPFLLGKKLQAGVARGAAIGLLESWNERQISFPLLCVGIVAVGYFTVEFWASLGRTVSGGLETQKAHKSLKSW